VQHVGRGMNIIANDEGCLLDMLVCCKKNVKMIDY